MSKADTEKDMTRVSRVSALLRHINGQWPEATSRAPRQRREAFLSLHLLGPLLVPPLLTHG